MVVCNMVLGNVVAGESVDVSDTLANAAASNDVRGVMQLLPDMVSISGEHPTEFLRLATVAMPVLATEAQSNPEVKQVAQILHEAVYATTSPEDALDAKDYFLLKSDLVGLYPNFETMRKDGDKDELIGQVIDVFGKFGR